MRDAENKAITIVSGLPRSGTSLMMHMLKAGGISLLVDDHRAADEDNPKGYYELDAVRRSRRDVTWVEDASGKAVKVIYRLLKCLPTAHKYRVLYMKRDIDEVIASQERMLVRRNEAQVGEMSHDQLSQALEGEWQQAWDWMQHQPNFTSLVVDYNHMIREPLPVVERIRQFLDDEFDMDLATKVIDSSLYRQRRNS